jgi:hypothetical protein
MLYAIGLISLFSTAAVAGKQRVGEGPCSKAAECRSGLCLEIGQESYCSQVCGDCPSGMQCNDAIFRPAGLAVCVGQPDGEPPELSSPPRMPCRSDRQCPGGTVCAQPLASAVACRAAARTRSARCRR